MGNLEPCKTDENILIRQFNRGSVIHMDFTPTKEHQMLRATVRAFAEREIKPIAADIDKDGDVPREILNRMGEMNLMGMTVPKEYGGAGCDRISYMIALEEIARVCGSTGIVMEAHNSLGLGHIYERGSEEQRRKWVPDSNREALITRANASMASNAADTLIVPPPSGLHDGAVPSVPGGNSRWCSRAA